MNKDLTILIPVRDEEENVKIISKEIISKILCNNYEVLLLKQMRNTRYQNISHPYVLMDSHKVDAALTMK